MKIADNRLLVGTVAALMFYWLTGLITPPNVFQPVITLLLVVTSGLVYLRSLPETLDIVFRGRRNEMIPEGDGSHLAVYGVNLIGLGGILAAIASFALALPATRPFVEHTPFETFGRAIAASGLALWFVSPNVSRGGVKFTGGAWFYVLAALTMIVVYAVGFSAGFREERRQDIVSTEDDFLPVWAPRCPSERTVWGSENGRYHSPSSRYRRQVIPKACFETEAEAEAAGYRAPG